MGAGYSPYSPYSTSATLPSSSVLNGISNNVNQAQSVLNQTPQTTVQDPTKQPNELEKLLPTFGSVLGGLAGGALDIGTGGLALAVDPALAGLGGSLGKSAENALTGQKVIQGNDITSGLEGAVGQGVGMGVGKLLGSAGGALTNLGVQKAAQAGTDDATQAAVDEATRVGNEFGAVKPGAASVGQAISKLNDLGIESPTANDAQAVGRIYTGSNPETGTGVLNFVKNDALDRAGGTVNLDNTMDQLHQTLAAPENQVLGGEAPVVSSSGQLPKAAQTTATKIVQQVRNMLPGATEDNGQLATEASPQDGKTLLTAIGKQIELTTPKANALGIVDPADEAENKVWRSVYQNVRDAVYNRPEVDAAVSGTTVTPELSDTIDDAIKSNGITDPKVAASIKADLTNTINNAQTGNDLLTAERPMVNVAKVGDIQTKDVANNPQLPRNVRAVKSAVTSGAPKRDLLGAGLDLGGVYEGLLKGHPAALLPALGYNIAKNPAALQGVGNVLSKVGGSALPAVAGEVVANSPNQLSGNAGTGQMIQGGNMNPIQNSLLGKALQQDLTMGQQAEADPYLAGNYSTGISQLSTLLPLIQKIDAAEQATQGLAGYFNQAGGAQGPVGGLLAKLGSVFTGGPAGSYGAQAQQAQQTIANALGVPESSVATPQITQNQTAAQGSLTNIQNLLSALQAPTSPGQ